MKNTLLNRSYPPRLYEYYGGQIIVHTCKFSNDDFAVYRDFSGTDKIIYPADIAPDCYKIEKTYFLSDLDAVLAAKKRIQALTNNILKDIKTLTK